MNKWHRVCLFAWSAEKYIIVVSFCIAKNRQSDLNQNNQQTQLASWLQLEHGLLEPDLISRSIRLMALWMSTQTTTH